MSMAVGSGGVLLWPGLVEEFRVELERLGYVPAVVVDHVRLFRQAIDWLQSGDGMAGNWLDEFVASRGRRRGVSATLLRSFLVARGLLAEPATPVAGPAERLVGEFGEYLRSERALGAGTIQGYVGVVRPFVASLVVGDQVVLAGIDAGAVFGFLSGVCPGRSRGGAQLVATATRQLLGWLFLTGRVDRPLAQIVPRVGSWKLARLVDPVPAGDVEQMLESCDRSTIGGRRDYAMLLLAARLGLRAGEIARVGLGDIDWRAGELVVVGKGPKRSVLPLPADVGAAIADYLRHGRPATAQGRSVFVRVPAPHRQLSTSGVTQSVFAAAARAGVGRVYAHRLRHSAATAMLAAGGSLAEIGEVLRHERPATTAIYAKVDLTRLRTIARPWPAITAGGRS